jgi:hypothetical protein
LPALGDPLLDRRLQPSQRHGKDPLAYLRGVLTRLPRMTNRDDLGPFTPTRLQPA